MKIAIGSTSPSKTDSIVDFFDISGFKVDHSSHNVTSGVSEQPIGLEEIGKGAENRARAAMRADQTAGLGIGLEAGLINDGSTHSLVCLAVIDNGKQYYKGQSDAIKLPTSVSDQIMAGGQFGQLIRAFNSDRDGFDKLTHSELINRQRSFNQALDRAFGDFLKNRPYRIGAIAYIFDENNNVLIDQLTDYAYEDWNFPGGGREPGESALDNIYRELSEELNIQKNQLDLIKQSEKPIKYDFPIDMLQAQHISALLYKGQIKAQYIFKFTGDKSSIKIDPVEIRRIQWVRVTELKKFLTFPNQYQISIGTIKDYVDNIDLN